MKDKKTFSIIHFRDLDSPESEDIIEILQSVMLERDIKTGQKALEYIVRRYQFLETRVYDDEQRYKRNIDAVNSSNTILSSELQNQAKFIDKIKAFKEALNEL